ncbi:histone deacetylase [Acinetobacter sp. WCHAc010052]|uniref:histone deacetylase n=1 Tax=Acinetobacter sp. WCHAc010052 TaxID=2004647 RepID=UPI000B3BEB90|nr:histone deacetylase [Acinetobacter sp. WCHAc010052]AXY59709.1 histone deacetylase [Acinetobacter sp. WCHAc010052]
MLNVCYSPDYFAQTHTNSMEKLKAVADALKKSSVILWNEPEAVSTELLYVLHDPAYVDAFLTGYPEKLATFAGFRPWNEQLKNAVLKINGGQLLAAELALEYGISGNIAQGFHHAQYEYGGSFCTFNGLALVAQKYPDKRIFVLDCDQHGGDGTAEFTRRLENLFNFSIYGLACDCPTYERSETRHIHREQGNFARYTMAIHEAFRTASLWQADLMIYQAGMDCHQADPFGSAWFSSELLHKRDEMVFSLAKKHDIPIMFVLAGGYQPLDDLVRLHLQTFDAALDVFYAV